MQTIFLKDGTQATLVSKIEDGFLVRKHIICEKYGDENPEEYFDESDKVEIVQEVFQKAPLDFIDAKYKKVAGDVEEQEKTLLEKWKELVYVQNQIRSLEYQKTNLAKLIINREELTKAKKLIAFKEGFILPTISGEKYGTKLTICFKISSYGAEESVYACNAYDDDRWGNDVRIDMEYGILVDLSDEEIKSLVIERLNKKPSNYFHDSQIESTPDEWLTPSYLERKNNFVDRTKRNRVERAKRELEKAQLEYEQIQKELTVS